jgi:hypothetical protein
MSSTDSACNLQSIIVLVKMFEKEKKIIHSYKYILKFFLNESLTYCFSITDLGHLTLCQENICFI